MNVFQRSCALASSVLAVLLSGAAADAQNGKYSSYSAGALPLTTGQLMHYNPREIVDGIRYGSWLYLPSVSASVAFDDNVFAASRRQRDDFVFNVSPEVRAISDWSRHHLEYYVRGSGSVHAGESGESGGAFNAGFASDIEIVRGTRLHANASYVYAREARGEGETVLGADNRFLDAIDYHDLHGGASIHHTFNRLWVQFGGAVRYSQYDDVNLVTPQADDTRGFRDGTIADVFSRVGYFVSPRTSVFVEGRYQERHYDLALLDSTGYRLYGGVNYEFSRLTRGEFAIGMLEQDLSAALGNNITTWAYKASLLFELSPFVTMALAGSRDVGAPSRVTGLAYRLETDMSARIDYAARYDLIISGLLGYTIADYSNDSGEDNRLRTQGKIEYFMMPRRSIWLENVFTHVDSNRNLVVDYNRNVTKAGVTLRF